MFVSFTLIQGAEPKIRAIWTEIIATRATSFRCLNTCGALRRRRTEKSKWSDFGLGADSVALYLWPNRKCLPRLLGQQDSVRSHSLCKYLKNEFSDQLHGRPMTIFWSNKTSGCCAHAPPALSRSRSLVSLGPLSPLKKEV